MTDAEISEINERRQQRVAHLRKVIALAQERIEKLAVPYEQEEAETAAVEDAKTARLTAYKWAKEHYDDASEEAEEGDFAKELLQRLRNEWPKNSAGVRIGKFGNDEYYTPHDALMDILWALTALINPEEDLEEWALGCVGSGLFEEAYTLGWNNGYTCLAEENARKKSF